MSLKTKDLKLLGEAEIEKKLKKLREELLKLRTQAASKAKIEKPKKMREIKKDIARILTFQNQMKKLKKSKNE